MLNDFFVFLSKIDEFFWGAIAFILIFVLGSYLTIKNRFFQLREISSIAKTFFQLLKFKDKQERGIHPLKAFFASAGGMIGIGNIVGIATAVKMGGPGALLWVWLAGFIGAIVKYGEIYLGIRYRVENASGGYDGGPMYFLKIAFKNSIVPAIVAVLLCIYGVEIYQFSVVTESLSSNWHLPKAVIIPFLLFLILYAGLGGVKRIGKICSWIMPLFMAIYLLMSFWVIGKEASQLPAIFLTMIKSAFTGHAAVGGFAGCGVIAAIQHGIARAAYSADIGIGYDSIIQSESSISHPEKQARLAILGVFLDNLICTLSILLVLVSGVWKAPNIEGSLLVQEALTGYFPFMDIFMPAFIAVCGYTTLIAFFCVGLKCASYLFPHKGRLLYVIYAFAALLFFAFFKPEKALIVMSVAGAMLLILNLLGIFFLRNEISFVSEDKSPAVNSLNKNYIN